MADKLKVYVGCALTHADEDFIEAVRQFKAALEAAGFEVLHFIGGNKAAPDITPNDVWKWDIVKCVDEAEAMIAILDLPSTGLGIEMEKAAGTHGIPLLAVAHHLATVSRLPLGMPYPNFRFQRYGVLSEVVDSFGQFLKEFPALSWPRPATSPTPA